MNDDQDIDFVEAQCRSCAHPAVCFARGCKAEVKLLQPHESTPQNNPNHPRICCVDGIWGNDPDPDGSWVCADDAHAIVHAPFRVFDILNQRHVGPKFPTRLEADAYLEFIGGAYAPSAAKPAPPPKPELLGTTHQLVSRVLADFRTATSNAGGDEYEGMRYAIQQDRSRHIQELYAAGILDSSPRV
jgi:hypothetical protein